MYKNPDPSKKRKNSTNEIYSISGYQQTTHYSYHARNAMLKYKVQTKPNPPRKHSMPSLAVFALDIIAHVTSQDMLPEHAFNQVLNSPITIITPAHAPHPQGPPNQTDHSLHSSRSSH